MPNREIPDHTPLSSFQVKLEEVERASGFLFFERIQNKYALPPIKRIIAVSSV